MEFLSKREQQIMDILWRSEKPMSCQDILIISPDLTQSTVQSLLRKLTKQCFIEVADVTIHNKALAREYRPAVSHIDYLNDKIGKDQLFDFVFSYIASSLTKEQVSIVIDCLNKEYQ